MTGAGASVGAFVIALVVGCAAQRPAPHLGVFVPTPTEIVERMLTLADVTRDDVVYDLGSGDGRIVNLAAERYGARGVGVEIDPQLVWFARRSATPAGCRSPVWMTPTATTASIPRSRRWPAPIPETSSSSRRATRSTTSSMPTRPRPMWPRSMPAGCIPSPGPRRAHHAGRRARRSGCRRRATDAGGHRRRPEDDTRRAGRRGPRRGV